MKESASDSTRPLIVAMIIVLALGATARAMSPTLLAEAPVVLALFDGRTASLLLLHQRLDATTFVIATAIGMSLGDPISFALGRTKGVEALSFLERFLPTTGFLATRVERLFRSTRGAPLIFTSGYVSCAVAGAAGVSWPAFAIFNLGSVAVRIGAVMAFSAAFSSSAGGIGNWVERYALPLTFMTVALVVIDLAHGRRRRLASRSVGEGAAGPDDLDCPR